MVILQLKNRNAIIINLILLEDLDIDKIQVSSMLCSGEKNYTYFIGYKDNDDYKT